MINRIKKLGQVIKRSFSPLDDFWYQDVQQPTASGVTVNESTALKSAAFYACVKVLSETGAMFPLILYERTEDGRERANNNYLYPLLHDRWNPFMNKYDCIELLIVHLCLYGNAYFFVEREETYVKALWPLPANRVEPKLADSGILFYELEQQDGTKKRFSFAEIMHVKFTSRDGIKGMSPIQSQSQVLGIALAQDEYTATFYKNDARPSGVLQAPGQLSEKTLKRLKKGWRSAYGGIDKSFLTAILEEGLEYKQMAITNTDAQLLENRQFTTEEVCRALRVPPAMIQYNKYSTYSNIREMSRNFARHTMIPLCSRIENAIAHKVLTENERRIYYPEFLADSLLRGDEETRAEVYEKALGAKWMTVNEVRKLENLPPLAGGDTFPEPEQPVKKKNRAIETRSAVEDRLALNGVYEPRIRDSIHSVVSIESEAIREAFNKYMPDERAFSKWLTEYYESFSKTHSAIVSPVLSEFANKIKRAAEAEMGLSETSLRDFISLHIGIVAATHSDVSRGQMEALIRDGKAEDILKRADEWMQDKRRAAKISRHQTASTSNKIFQETAYVNNRSVVLNNAGESTCPFCTSVSGKILHRGKVVVDAGTWTGSDGQTMDVSHPKLHPPLHSGCDCFLTGA